MPFRWILNLVLLAAVAGLGLWFWLAPEDLPEAPVAISAIDIDRVQGIRFTRPDHDAVELHRENGDWRLLEPLAVAADDNRAEGLLLLAATASLQRYSAIDLDLARYGLEPGVAVLQLDAHRFVIGDEHPLHPKRYVLYEDTVHLVPDTLYRELEAPATWFADGRLLPVREPPLRIVLPDRTLTRSDAGWRADPPLEGRSPDAAGNAWRTAYAFSLQRYDAAAAGDHGAVIVEFEGADPLALQIVSPPPNVVLARPELGLQYHLDSKQIVRLLLVNEEMR